jgi:hypothetical protein
MKLPGWAPPKSDRLSTREELSQVLELLGGFEESQFAELAQKADLIASLETPDTPSEILEELIASEERLLTEIDSFDSLLAARKAERIN